MSIFAAAVLCVVAWLSVAALGGSAATVRAGLFIALALLPLPWLVSATDQQRVALAFAIGFILTSAVDFAAGRTPDTFSRRLLYVIAFFALIDLMTARPARRHDHAGWRRILAASLCGGVAVAMIVAVKAQPASIRIPLRLVLSAALILIVAELITDLVRVLSERFGMSFDPVHERPSHSVTLTDFWSRRWNRMGARWFRRHVFVRLRATNVVLAIFAVFFVSAAMHVYLIAAVVKPSLLIACASFFLLQPPLLMLERHLRVRRWPAVAGRVWTAMILIALLPLVLLPLLAAVHIAL